MARRIAPRLVSAVAVMTLGASASVPCAALDMFRPTNSGCSMPLERDCTPTADAQGDCCVVEARAPQPPATFTFVPSFPPAVGVIVPAAFQVSYGSLWTAYRWEMLKIPRDPTYVLTSRFLL